MYFCYFSKSSRIFRTDIIYCRVHFAFTFNSLAIRIYNTYLEYCYFSYPQYRTQPPKEHVLKKCGKELCGRDREQLELLLWHDRLTFITQTLLYYGLYYAVPGFYPVSKARSEYDPLPLRILMLVMNHLVLSFSMYWMHRALHKPDSMEAHSFDSPLGYSSTFPGNVPGPLVGQFW